MSDLLKRLENMVRGDSPEETIRNTIAAVEGMIAVLPPEQGEKIRNDMNLKFIQNGVAHLFWIHPPKKPN